MLTTTSASMPQTASVSYIYFRHLVLYYLVLQCFDTVGWAAGRASGLKKMGGDGGSGHWLVRMEWRPAGWSVSASVNLPLHHKVQKFSSGTGSPGWSQKKGCKIVVVVVVLYYLQTKLSPKIEVNPTIHHRLLIICY